MLVHSSNVLKCFFSILPYKQKTHTHTHPTRPETVLSFPGGIIYSAATLQQQITKLVGYLTYDLRTVPYRRYSVRIHTFSWTPEPKV